MLKKCSTAEAVFQLLKRRIENRELKPGEALPSERDLQRELGISRISLREGLARLTALGIIDVAHGKGAIVANTVRPEVVEAAFLPLMDADDPESIDDLYEARAMMESEVASLAAVRRDDAVLEELTDNLKASDAALEDEQRFVALDLQFHRLVAKASGNRYLQVMCSAIEASTRKLVRIHDSDREKRSGTLNRHRKLFEAVESGDVERARNLARKHLEESRDLV